MFGGPPPVSDQVRALLHEVAEISHSDAMQRQTPEQIAAKARTIERYSSEPGFKDGEN